MKDYLYESQMRHGYLMQKHAKQMRFNKRHWVFAQYHATVRDVQRSKNKILPYSERRKIFKKCEKTFENN